VSAPLLIVLGGLPGSGKTTLARGLAIALGASHVRIDTIEQALLRSSLRPARAAEAGYGIGMAVATDDLRVGRVVVADAVNAVYEARAGWLAAAEGAACVEVWLTCSDAGEHRARIESRDADIPGHRQPTWADTTGIEVDPWPGAHLVDTAGRAPSDVLAEVLAIVEQHRP